MKMSDAEHCLGLLIGGTPGPWNEDVVDVWLDKFAALDDADALHRVCSDLIDGWTERYRPAMGEVIEAYHARRALRMRELLPSTTQCDGTGWVPTGKPGERRPCRRCNSALAEVFDDPDKLERWRNGIGLHQLDVGVERKRDGSMRRTRGDNPICHAAPDGGVLDVDTKRGVPIARQAYRDERESQGREVTYKGFDRTVRAIGRRS